MEIINIAKDWQISLGVDDILRGQGMDPKTDRRNKPMLRMVAERARLEGLGLIHPVAIANETYVREQCHERIFLEDKRILTGPLVTSHLSGAKRVAAVVCTIGSELEEAVSNNLSEDPLFALALDGLGNAAVVKLAQQICARLGDKIMTEGFQASTPLSPGVPEWPVEIGQPQIFALIDPSRAGVTLTSSGMMYPKKSISFVVGFGKEMSQAGMCEVCSLKKTCRYGHV